MASRKKPCCSNAPHQGALSKTDIPDEIQKKLDKTGGLAGLIARLPSEENLDQKSRVFHALSDPLRLTILFLVKDQPLCVCVIKSVLGIADSKLSYHLTILKKAGLIVGEQLGNWVIYRITEKGISSIAR